MKRLLAVLFICALVPGIPAQASAQSRGQRAPGFALSDMEGNYVDLESLLGKGPILLSFWATWCTPCLEELSELQKFIPSYQARGVIAVAISTDSEKSVAKVKPFVMAKGYPFLVLLDTNSEVARRYYANPIPFTVILDRGGYVVFKHLGYKQGDELDIQRTLDALLKP